jgi:phage-related protein
VFVLDQAHADASGFLDADQYEHLARQVRELATQDDATRSATVDVRPVEDFYEIRDKGGVLRRLNVRVFYFVHKPSRAVVVLGAIKKENDGHTPLGDKVTMRRRMRLFLEWYEAQGKGGV